MAGNTKEIQRRIKSIKNTRKITRAMEMVAAAKMKKEVNKVLAIRPYAQAAWSVLTNLSRAFEKYQHGLLEAREVRNILVVLITSNRGLCGGYNAQLLKKVFEQIQKPTLLKINRIGNRRIISSVPDDQLKFDFIAVGKKGFEAAHIRGYNILATFDEFNYLPSAEDIRSLAKIVMDDYIDKKYDKVVVAYTDYLNAISQIPKLRQLLPISRIDLEKQITEMSSGGSEENEVEVVEEKLIDYKIEPEPQEVIGHILPRLVEMQLYHAILESNASKESARMMAMRNATEAAEEMIEHLHYSYNQVRQMGITQEIAEITSGRIAMEE